MKTFLGIELGSTRIKAVLIDQNGSPLASGGFDWENRFENGVWTYYLDDVWTGLKTSIVDLYSDYQKTYKKPVEEISGIGVSAMMHGYLVLDADGNQLTEFRTWRNTLTEESAAFQEISTLNGKYLKNAMGTNNLPPSKILTSAGNPLAVIGTVLPLTTATVGLSREKLTIFVPSEKVAVRVSPFQPE